MTEHAILVTLRQCASRHSRVDHEADDLMQDVLLLAVARGRPITDPGFMAWAKGAIRNHARFIARTAGRRRVRDAAWGTPCAAPNPVPRFSHAFLSSLPSAQRMVALLINLGLDRAEITHLLGLSDAAFRQRLSGLRKALQACTGEAEFFDGFSPVQGDGLARRSLKQSLHPHAPRTFAIRDPDSVPIFFSRRDHIPGAGGN